MICAEFINGQFTESTQAPSECTGFILMTAQEADQLVNFNTFFAIPDTAIIERFFFLGFSSVMLCYFAAFAYGQIINWFNDHIK